MSNRVFAFTTGNKTLIKWIIYCLILGLLWMFLSKLDWYTISQQLIEIGWRFWLIIPINFLSYFFGTLSWNYCLGKERNRHSLKTLFIIRHIGETLAIINPTNIVAGDGAKHLLLKDRCTDKNSSLSSIFLSRIIVILSAVLLVIFSLLVLIGREISYDINFVSLFVLLVLLIVGSFLFWQIFTHRALFLFKISRKLLKRLDKWYNGDGLLHKIKHLNYTISQFNHNDKSSLWKAIFFALLHWLFGAIEFWIILILLGLNIGFLDGIISEMGIAVIKSMGSFVPGQVGVEEYGNKMMLAILGVSSSVIWVSVSILRRLRQIIWIGLGVLFYIFYKKQGHGSTVHNP